MSDEFSGPGSAVGIKWEDLMSRLLLFTVHKLETDLDSRYGKGDAVRADVNVLDGPTEGEGFAQTLVWPKVLQSQLRGSVGGRVLGRLTKGTAKTGQSAPWMLDDPTEDDKVIARKWIAEHDRPPF